jgi:hypothetical protein
MNLTRDCVIEFTEAVFVGKYPKAKYSHDRTIKALIIKESYGVKKGQHTFSLKVLEADDSDIIVGSIIRRKGRNVYPNCKLLETPENYKELQEEKQKRKKKNKKENYQHDLYSRISR